jgi:hypothetical protein
LWGRPAEEARSSRTRTGGIHTLSSHLTATGGIVSMSSIPVVQREHGKWPVRRLLFRSDIRAFGLAAVTFFVSSTSATRGDVLRCGGAAQARYASASTSLTHYASQPRCGAFMPLHRQHVGCTAIRERFSGSQIGPACRPWHAPQSDEEVQQDEEAKALVLRRIRP